MWSRSARVRSFPSPSGQSENPGKSFLGISLNNVAMSNAGLLRHVLAWMGANYAPFDVLVGDYLHRHNLQMFDGLPESNATQTAMLEGAAASQRIEHIAQLCGLQCNILSTREHLESAGAGHRIAAFRKHYTDGGIFRVLVDEAVDQFLRRKEPALIQIESARSHCREYQYEELVVFESLVLLGYTTHVYPGNQLPLLKEIVKGGLPGIAPNLESLSLVELKF